MQNLDRDCEIWRRRKGGEMQKALAAEFKLSPERIKEICTEQRFRELEPDLAKACSDRERPLAAFLWSRGFKIEPPPSKPDVAREESYLDQMELSVRAARVLHDNGITSKEQISKLTEDQILALAGAGKLTAEEIIKARSNII